MSRQTKKRLFWALGGPAAVGAVLLVGYWVWTAQIVRGQDSASSLQFYDVVRMNLDVTVEKDGELQAVESIDIINRVEGNTTIIWVIPEGETVTQGQPILRLDSALIRQRIEDTMLELEKATADLTNSIELLAIQRSKNDADLEAARVAVELAELELKQYEQGTWPQQLNDAQTAVEMSRITLNNREEDLAQSRALFARGFVTAAEIKRSELEVTNAQNAFNKAKTHLDVLTRYTHQMNLASKRNALEQARQRYQRVLRENASAVAQREADVRARDTAKGVIERRLARLREQEAACEVLAPESGLVVYATSSDRNAQNVIQEGAQVRERQTLLRLPDTSRMKAVVRLNEAQVSRVRYGMRAMVRIVGTNRTIEGTVRRISVLADSGQRWWNPDLKEYPVDIILDETPPGLKPGMGAQVEIFVHKLVDVLAVPMAAVFSAGRDSFVFVPEANSFRPVKVETGPSGKTHVQITSGLSGGERVLLLQAGQGRELLERAGITPRPVIRGGFGQRPGEREEPNGGIPPGVVPGGIAPGGEIPRVGRPPGVAPVEGLPPNGPPQGERPRPAELDGNAETPRPEGQPRRRPRPEE